MLASFTTLGVYEVLKRTVHYRAIEGQSRSRRLLVMVMFGGGRCLLTIVMLRHMPAVRANPNYAVSKCFRLEYYRTR